MADEVKVVLDCIQAMRQFDGRDATQLLEYIEQVETLLPIIEMCEEQFRPILFTFVKYKCVGRARLVMHACGQPKTWPEICKALKANFGEKKKFSELMHELKTLQFNGTVKNFYYKIMKIIQRINLRRLTHADVLLSPSDIQSEALNVFQDHLPGPVRGYIIIRDPRDLREAYDFMLEYDYQNCTAYSFPNDSDTTAYETNLNDHVSANRNHNLSRNNQSKNMIQQNNNSRRRNGYTEQHDSNNNNGQNNNDSNQTRGRTNRRSNQRSCFNDYYGNN